MSFHGFRVLYVYAEYGIHSGKEEEVYCRLEYGGYFYNITLEKQALINKADELYNGNSDILRKEEQENPDFWAKIAQSVLYDMYDFCDGEEFFETLNRVPDIAEAGFLTQELYIRVVESEDNMAFLEIDEKEDLENESGKSWDILEKELEEDIRKFGLKNVLEIGDEPLAIGYGDLQLQFKESKKRWAQRFLGTDEEIVRFCI